MPRAAEAPSLGPWLQHRRLAPYGISGHAGLGSPAYPGTKGQGPNKAIATSIIRHARRHIHALHSIVAALLIGLTLAGCGGSGGSGGASDDWYYHWDCNGDTECLATNPTGASSGTLNEGPNESSCTELLTFAKHFWGPAATNSCDHDPNGSSSGGSGSAPTVDSF